MDVPPTETAAEKLAAIERCIKTMKDNRIYRQQPGLYRRLKAKRDALIEAKKIADLEESDFNGEPIKVNLPFRKSGESVEAFQARMAPPPRLRRGGL